MLTEEEIKAIEREAESMAIKRFNDPTYWMDSNGMNFKEGVISALTQERIKAKQLIKYLEEITQLSNGYVNLKATQAINEYNTKQIEP